MRGAAVRLTALRFLARGQPYALRRYASWGRKPWGRGQDDS